jgi:hypothetical protein
MEFVILICIVGDIVQWAEMAEYAILYGLLLFYGLFCMGCCGVCAAYFLEILMGHMFYGLLVFKWAICFMGCLRLNGP